MLLNWMNSHKNPTHFTLWREGKWDPERLGDLRSHSQGGAEPVFWLLWFLLPPCFLLWGFSLCPWRPLHRPPSPSCSNPLSIPGDQPAWTTYWPPCPLVSGWVWSLGRACRNSEAGWRGKLVGMCSFGFPSMRLTWACGVPPLKVVCFFWFSVIVPLSLWA